MHTPIDQAVTFADGAAFGAGTVILTTFVISLFDRGPDPVRVLGRVTAIVILPLLIYAVALNYAKSRFAESALTTETK